jgi:hypothetical protein
VNRYAIKSPETGDFVEYPSVTQITGQTTKGDGLLYWAAGQAVKYIEQNYNMSYDLYENSDNLDKVLKAAKSEWKNMRDATADIGTELHNIVEIYIKRAIKENNPLWLDKGDIRSFIKDFNHNLLVPFMQFYLWVRDNVKQFLESEKPVVHVYDCYGGTCDIIFINFKDETVLCDLKTKNALYGDDKFQLSAYKNARENMQGNYSVLFYGVKSDYSYEPIKIDRIAILKIARDFFDLEYKDYTKDYKYAIIAFRSLLDFFFVSAKRRLNCRRAKERV